MGRVLRWILGLVVILVALGVAVYLILQPPSPLPLPTRGAVLNDVTVIEPGQSRAEHRDVVVKEGTIETIDAASPGAGGPYAGMYVLPGLVDMHVHFPPSSLPGQSELFAFLFLYHGVTTVRDAGDVDGTASEPARRGVADGRFPGPRIKSCGPFVDGEPFRWKNSLRATNPEEGRRAVQTLAERGFDCVKAYNELDAETLAAIRDEAKARNLPVIGHVPHRVPYEVAKLDDAQHLIGVPPPLSDPPPRFPLNLVAFQQMDDARLDFIIAESLRSNITNTPTLVTVDRLIHTEDYARMLQEPDAQLLPRFYREVIWNPVGGTSAAAGLSSDDFAMARESFEHIKRVVRKLHDGGVQIHTGTDTLIAFVVPGAALHRELRLLVDAGFTPEEALALSTHDSAEFLRVPGLGSLKPGAPADLLVFRKDPTQSLDALDSLVAVVRDGRLYTREALDAQMKRYKDHFDGKLYDAIVTPLVRRALASATSH